MINNKIKIKLYIHTFSLLLSICIIYRLYNVLKPTSPEELIPLGESSSMTAEYSRKSMSVGSMSSFAAALGETAIAFDFAPAVNVVDLKGSYRSSETDAEVAHPIFILRENGDIYYLVHKISSSRCVFFDLLLFDSLPVSPLGSVSRKSQ